MCSKKRVCPRCGELLPGSGSTFGNAIVEHPKTRLIAFTGSKEVGLDIHARAAQTRPGQIWIKRTILEMGGKDSIIVSTDCDLDAAVEGVVASAFGFNGQKCSACSRAIVEDAVYDVFLERVRERVQALQVGDPAANAKHGAGGKPLSDGYDSLLHRDRQGRGTAVDGRPRG